MSFSKMKKSAGKMDSIMDELNKIQKNQKTNYKDDRFWKP